MEQQDANDKPRSSRIVIYSKERTPISCSKEKMYSYSIAERRGDEFAE
jgi:hypothetical protein